MDLKVGLVSVGERSSWRSSLLIGLDEANCPVTFNVGVGDLNAVPYGAGDPDAVLVVSSGTDIDLNAVKNALPIDAAVPLVVVLGEWNEAGAVKLLENGADEIIAWPMSPQLLAANLRAVVRRVAQANLNPGFIRVRDLVLDNRSHEVYANNRPVNLTPSEFRMLACMISCPGQVVSARMLLKEAQGYETEDQEAQDIVKVHIRRLRNKIEPEPSRPTYIVNVRGFGYRLERRGIEPLVISPPAAAEPAVE